MQLLLLFFASGFAGLIYQSIWTQYLGLMLGHAALAQSLVLAIFMGGMAGGAWLVAKYSTAWRRLVLAYALVEAAIGVAGLLFHPIYAGYSAWSYSVVFPALDSATAVAAYQWLTASLLILPQCLLLGASFPLLSAAYLRAAPDQAGQVLGGLYFSNSVGAGIGVLIASFVLVPQLGLPNTLLTAGLINLVVAAGAWRVSQGNDLPLRAVDGSSDAAQSNQKLASTALFRGLLLATFLSGGFSFVYELGWIRLLNQVLGSTIHSFEIMLAAFILGLAFGGLWVRRQASNMHQPMLVVGWAQVLMGAAAAMSLVIYGMSFDWVSALLDVLPRSNNGYFLYSVASAGLAMLVMAPAAFFAGMTLPLFSTILIQRGAGESSIGQIYAANTLGAILGVLVALHVLIPTVGNVLAMCLAATGDIAIGLALLAASSTGKTTARPRVLVASCVGLAAVAIAVLFGRPDPLQQVAGVFRHGQLPLPAESTVHYLRDGKTSTVGVYSNPEQTYAAITTNGKIDATLAVDPRDPPADDEITMLMAAALPMAMHSSPERVAVIGWGSGLSTHAVLGSAIPRQVDTIEIEQAMIDGARSFGPRVARAYEDSRSNIIVNDARSVFAGRAGQYDIIISEPSNPWISGVASLFTQEFYQLASSQLSDGGILLQWLQTYEISDAVLCEIIAALLEEFTDVRAYVSNTADMLLVASMSPLPDTQLDRLQSDELGQELARVGLSSDADLESRAVAGRELLETYVQLFGARPHSDYWPTVSHRAPVDRFVGRSASTLQLLAWDGLAATELAGLASPPPALAQVNLNAVHPQVSGVATAAQIVWSRQQGRFHPELPAEAKAALATLDAAAGKRLRDDQEAEWAQALAALSAMLLPSTNVQDLADFHANNDWLPAELPPSLDGLAQVMRAAMARDTAEVVRLTASILAEYAEAYAPDVLEQLVVLASAASLAEDDFGAPTRLEQTHGAQAAQKLLYARSVLLAHAETLRDELAATP